MPNIDFDQKPRGAADRGEYRQAAGATSTEVAQGGFLMSAFGGKSDIPPTCVDVCF
jgi:hypothetical protein